MHKIPLHLTKWAVAHESLCSIIKIVNFSAQCSVFLIFFRIKSGFSFSNYFLLIRNNFPVPPQNATEVCLTNGFTGPLLGNCEELFNTNENQ